MLSPDSYFITGTDTGVGKTHITLKLIQYFIQHGFKTLAMKPIASGCELVNGHLQNEDAQFLQKAASKQLPYNIINPFAFLPSIAPHIAAIEANTLLSKQLITEKIELFLSQPADVHLIEGAGGWMLPINQTETFAEVIGELQLKIILVVKMQLGCLNHALLTYHAIQQHKLVLAGWVANTMGAPMPHLHENIETLSTYFNQPPLPV